MPLNLAKRPFVDTRPVNSLTAFLVGLVLVLSVVSWRTFHTYLAGSRGTQAAIGDLRREISRYESARKASEAALARIDVEELGASAEDANEIARRRSFSWTRFLTRLEETLPPDVRVVAIALARSEREAKGGGPSAAEQGMPLEMTLISRDERGMPRTITALYASRWFDEPLPRRDESPERGSPEGRRLTIGVRYIDEGRTDAPPKTVSVKPPDSRPAKRVAAGKGTAR